MEESDPYATIRTRKEARNKARVAKARLGVTWETFLTRAADSLVPESDN